MLFRVEHEISFTASAPDRHSAVSQADLGFYYVLSLNHILFTKSLQMLIYIQYFYDLTVSVELIYLLF